MRSHGPALRIQLFRKRIVADSQDLCGQHSRVFCAPDGNRRYRDAAGHLNRGKQCVQSVHRAALHGDADYGECGISGKSTGKMRRHSGSADEHAEAVCTGTAGKIRCGSRRTVGTENMGLKGDPQLIQLDAGSFDDGPIGIRAHNDGYFFHCSCSSYYSFFRIIVWRKIPSAKYSSEQNTGFPFTS